MQAAKPPERRLDGGIETSHCLDRDLGIEALGCRNDLDVRRGVPANGSAGVDAIGGQ